MIRQTVINNWVNGNVSDISRNELIRLVIFFEHGARDEDIIQDIDEY